MAARVMILSICLAPVAMAFSPTNWNALSVTFGTPQTAPKPFDPLPTKLNGIGDGWTLVDNGCSNPNLHYKGQRYIKNMDHGMMLIFDVNGIVAGLQMAIPQDKADLFKNDFVDYSTSSEAVPQTIDGIVYYVFTVYFVDPSTICSEGRTETKLKKDGTGTGLYLQNGKDPLTTSVRQPMSTVFGDEVFRKQKLTRQKCFPMMGRHYFKGLDQNSNCKTLGPFFLLYDDMDNQLVAFGIITAGNYESSRFEHPPLMVIEKFLNHVPDCTANVYSKAGGVTSMHVYLKWPLVEKCLA